jgi:hypothetical protein
MHPTRQIAGYFSRNGEHPVMPHSACALMPMTVAIPQRIHPHGTVSCALDGFHLMLVRLVEFWRQLVAVAAARAWRRLGSPEHRVPDWWP